MYSAKLNLLPQSMQRKLTARQPNSTLRVPPQFLHFMTISSVFSITTTFFNILACCTSFLK